MASGNEIIRAIVLSERVGNEMIPIDFQANPFAFTPNVRPEYPFTIQAAVSLCFQLCISQPFWRQLSVLLWFAFALIAIWCFFHWAITTSDFAANHPGIILALWTPRTWDCRVSVDGNITALHSRSFLNGLAALVVQYLSCTTSLVWPWPAGDKNTAPVFSCAQLYYICGISSSHFAL